jgi:H/ACA ribonucleoprotein complex subunit 3
MKHIKKCNACNRYTMLENCPVCKKPTIIPRPAKYSPEDRIGKYRLQAKIEMGIIKDNKKED